jgi:hypothetical protein
MCFWGVLLLLVSRGGAGRPAVADDDDDVAAAVSAEEGFEGEDFELESAGECEAEIAAEGGGGGLLWGGPTGTMREPNSTPMVTS